MKIVCSKFDCYTDYFKCKDCQYKVKSVFTKESEQKIQAARAEAEQKIQKIREEIYSMEQTLLKQIPYVSCYHALNADDLKFNVAVFKDDCIQPVGSNGGLQPLIKPANFIYHCPPYHHEKEQKDVSPPQKEQDTIKKKESVTIETVKPFNLEVYDRVILTEL